MQYYCLMVTFITIDKTTLCYEFSYIYWHALIHFSTDQDHKVSAYNHINEYVESYSQEHKFMYAMQCNIIYC